LDLWEIGWRWSGHVGEGKEHPRVRSHAVREKVKEDVRADVEAMRLQNELDKEA
jgi:hypothetical protein